MPLDYGRCRFYGSWKWKSLSCLTLCEPMDCSLQGSSVHGISQARILEWVAIPFSRGSSWPKDWTWVSCIAGGFFTELPGKPIYTISSVQFSRSVVSDSFRPHESQHTRPPVHHQLPEFTETHVHWVSDGIQPSHPLSDCKCLKGKEHDLCFFSKAPSIV